MDVVEGSHEEEGNADEEVIAVLEKAASVPREHEDGERDDDAEDLGDFVGEGVVVPVDRVQNGENKDHEEDPHPFFAQILQPCRHDADPVSGSR